MQKFAFDLFWNQFRVMSLTILNFLSQMLINLKCINKNRKIFNETCEMKTNDEPQNPNQISKYLRNKDIFP